jgi:tryptophan-rich sensory protein
MNSFFAYFGSFSATFLAAVAGSVASIQAAKFYGDLTKPSWAPPGTVFGPVWTVLFLMMALAGGMALSAGGSDLRLRVAVFLLQLMLNALWSWTFFKWQSGPASIVTISVLWTAILLNMIAFWKVSSISGALMLPYLAWVTFAGALNLAIWNLNRELL